MSVLSIFKKKKEEVIPAPPKKKPEQLMNNSQAAARHKGRIDNLFLEYEVLVVKLNHLEQDIEMPKATKSKEADLMIRRMTLIKYEIGIREDAIDGLNS